MIHTHSRRQGIRPPPHNATKRKEQGNEVEKNKNKMVVDHSHKLLAIVALRIWDGFPIFVFVSFPANGRERRMTTPEEQS